MTDTITTTILWAIVAMSLMFVFYTLARFSKRLGDALHLKPYYVLYYLALLFLFIDIQTDLLGALGRSYPAASGYWCDVSMPFGMTIAVATTARYWGWLLKIKD